MNHSINYNNMEYHHGEARSTRSKNSQKIYVQCNTPAHFRFPLNIATNEFTMERYRVLVQRSYVQIENTSVLRTESSYEFLDPVKRAGG